MTQQRDIKEYIESLGRLFEYSSNKKYRIKRNEFLHDHIGQLAMRVNSEIIAKHNLDVFKLESTEQLTEYSEMLGRLLSEYTYRSIVSRDYDDEIKLLRRSYLIDPVKLRELNMDISEFIRDFFDKLPVKAIDIIKWIHSKSVCVAFVPDKELIGIYFVTFRATIDSVERIIIVNLDHQDRVGNKFDDRKVRIVSIFIVRHSSYQELIQYPIRLFLRLLDIYGLDIEINQITKRFHKEAHVPMSIYSPSLNFMMVKNPKASDVYTTFSLMLTKFGAHLQFVYGINKSKYLDDLVKGAI